MRRMKMMAAAGALVGSALIGGTMVSAALAAPATTSGVTTVAAQVGVSDTYLNAFLDTLASELGVDRAALGAASLAAASAAIDVAVEAGDLSADRATELRDELAALDDPASMLLGRGIFGHGPGHNGLGYGADAADAAASELGIDSSELRDQLRSGSSLMQVAVAEEVGYASVVSAVTDAVVADLATAVSDGQISQERSDEIMADLQTWLDAGGQPGEGAFGFGGGFGHGGRGHGPMELGALAP